jgi:outer membrane lipoprotein LolB
MTISRRRAGWLLAAGLALAGCAPLRTAHPPVAGSTGPWSGRLALQVQDRQAESFSATFELKGKAEAGELALYTPIGSTLAVLQWAPGTAVLKANGEVRQFDSLDALAGQVTGAAIPVAALFDWLVGSDTRVAGWEADLSQLDQGRVRARRLEPPPPAELRVVLDR